MDLYEKRATKMYVNVIEVMYEVHEKEAWVGKLKNLRSEQENTRVQL